MRCHEAKKRIDARDFDDAALTEHLRRCVGCSQLADAEQRLASSLQHAALSASPAVTPLEQLRQRIEQATVGAQQKERHIMSEISHQIRIHPRLSVGMVLAVLVFMFTTLIPFSYQRISGYDATIAFAGVTGEIPQAKVEKALESIGQSNIKVSVEQTGENTNYRLKGFVSEAKAFEAVLALEMQAGTKGQSRIRPILENGSSSLVAQVLDGVKSVKVEDTKGKTDSEVEQDIAVKMLAAGLLSPKVTVTTDADGTRKALADTYVRTKAGQDSVAIRIKWDMGDEGELSLRFFIDDSSGKGTATLNVSGSDTSKNANAKRRVDPGRVKMESARKGSTVRIEEIGKGK